ncbi:MAG: C40 family peptidase [Enterocloster sp.]
MPFSSWADVTSTAAWTLTSGVDCSGFTRYVLGKAASISLPHSSTGQSSYGKAVTEDQMQPGDLLFYSGRWAGINHVALYIGDGTDGACITQKRRESRPPHIITENQLRL